MIWIVSDQHGVIGASTLDQQALIARMKEFPVNKYDTPTSVKVIDKRSPIIVIVDRAGYHIYTARLVPEIK